MICKNCGTINDDDKLFCSKCGKELSKNDFFTFNSDDFKVEAPNYDDILGYKNEIKDIKEELKKEFVEDIKQEKPTIHDTKKEKIIKKNIDDNKQIKNNFIVKNEKIKQNDKINNKKTVDLNNVKALGYYHEISFDICSLKIGLAGSIFGIIFISFLLILLISVFNYFDFQMLIFLIALICIDVFFIYRILTYKERKTNCLLANNVLKNGQDETATIKNLEINHTKYTNEYSIEYKYKIGDSFHVSKQWVSFETFKKLEKDSSINIKIGGGLGVFDESAFLKELYDKRRKEFYSQNITKKTITNTKMKYITNSFGETIAIPEEQEEVIYVDEQGNELSKEEVEALNLDIVGYKED